MIETLSEASPKAKAIQFSVFFEETGEVASSLNQASSNFLY